MSRNIQVPIKSISELDGIQDTREGKLIFTTVKSRKMAFLVKGNRLIAAQVLSAQGNIGAIYIGRVQKFSSNINAFFVEIAPGEMCFLPVKELYPGQVLKGGDELPVQIIREAQKTKLPTVSAKISLANDYVAVSLGSPKTGYSNKLSAEKKTEIAGWLKEQGIIDRSGRFCGSEQLQGQYQSALIGIVVRTLAGMCEKDVFLEAVNGIVSEFIQLLQTAAHRNALSCLQPAPSVYEAAIKQLVFPHEYQEIVTDDREAYTELRTILKAETIRLYEDSQFTLTKLYALETKLEEALERCVWLKSGAYLVIEPTEALTVIDVNSGKFEPSKHKSLEDMTYTVNKEAVIEIALQLRLRNLSGMILVDFINMNSKQHEMELLQYLTELVKADRQLTCIVDITPLGLVEITRQKKSKTLAEQMKD